MISATNTARTNREKLCYKRSHQADLGRKSALTYLNGIRSNIWLSVTTSQIISSCVPWILLLVIKSLIIVKRNLLDMVFLKLSSPIMPPNSNHKNFDTLQKHGDSVINYRPHIIINQMEKQKVQWKLRKEFCKDQWTPGRTSTLLFSLGEIPNLAASQLLQCSVSWAEELEQSFLRLIHNWIYQTKRQQLYKNWKLNNNDRNDNMIKRRKIYPLSEKNKL